MRRSFQHLPPALLAITIAVVVLCAIRAIAEETDDAGEDGVAAAEADEAPAPKPVGNFRRPVMIRFEDEITPMSRSAFERRLATARDEEADLVIVEITSPGGTVTDSLALGEAMLAVDWARCVAYVPDEALSGGAFFSLGCKDIVMAPRAKLGDAGPIFFDAQAWAFRHASEKFRSDLVRSVRDLAEASGRPPALAEAMVDADAVVHRYENKQTGQTRYLTEADAAGLDEPDRWTQGPMVSESREGLFLEVNGRRAAQLGLADAVVDGLDALKQRYGIDGELPVLEHTTLDTVVMILNSGIVTWLIFVIGLIALYVEFSAPGIGLGGLVAALCFALFFWSRFLGGTGGWLEVVLFLAGVGFLLVELLVLPGFGMAGILGILMLVAALVLAGQATGIPDTRGELARFAQSLFVMASAGVTVAIAAYFLRRNFGMIPLARQLMLQPPEAAMRRSGSVVPEGNGNGGTGVQGSLVLLEVGTRGVAHTPLRPAGRGRFGDRFVNVVTDSEFVQRGRPIEIVETGGSQIVVRPV